MQYNTDEEVLEKETEWIFQRSKRENKKRKIQHSPEILVSASKEVPKAAIQQRPPPITLSITGKSYRDIFAKLKDSVKHDFLFKLISKDSYKINLFNSLEYRAITAILNKSQSSWHSYENKQTRQIKVMIKDLHFSCDPKDIVEDLIQQGYKDTKATNKLKYKTIEPLNMFIAEFDSSENI